jgi:hypothetical protein
MQSIYILSFKRKTDEEIAEELLKDNKVYTTQNKVNGIQNT